MSRACARVSEDPTSPEMARRTASRGRMVDAFIDQMFARDLSIEILLAHSVIAEREDAGLRNRGASGNLFVEPSAELIPATIAPRLLGLAKSRALTTVVCPAGQ